MDDSPLLLFGASVRAAAHSCVRAGFDCVGADLFADVDACELATVERVTTYPEDFRRIARNTPPSRWLYTGGLENFPDVIKEISQRHRLWGNAGEAVARVRDPVLLRRKLHNANLPVPRVAIESPAWEADIEWVQKPIRSCGGNGIRFADKGTARNPPGTYLQEYIEGVPASATFVGTSDGSNLLGVTRQLIHESWTGAARFQYAGSIGPLRLPDEIASQVRLVGEVLVREFGLRGLFGVDGLLNTRGFWTVEVNPRYTASMEILERAGVGPLLRRHADAFGEKRSGASRINVKRDVALRIQGKAIVYALTSVAIANAFHEFVEQANSRDLPLIADIPHNSTKIAARQPICTVFADGEDEVHVVRGLQSRAEEARSVASCS